MLLHPTLGVPLPLGLSSELIGMDPIAGCGGGAAGCWGRGRVAELLYFFYSKEGNLRANKKIVKKVHYSLIL